jgi:formylglycine-generating enzyme required for sulfatase activity
MSDQQENSEKVLSIVDDYPKHDFGDFFVVHGLDLEMKKINPGSFHMGTDDGPLNERPRHRVNITRPFWMGLYPVTQAQYEELTGDNPSNFNGPNLPVEKVSWTAAMEFCEELTENERAEGRIPEGYAYRLPTEAEWEYTCRAGSEEDFPIHFEHVAWFFKNSNEQSHEVGLKEPNGWGFFDMQGNVFEWCSDGADFRDPNWYKLNTQLTPEYRHDIINPFHKAGANRIAKGGCWLLDDKVARPAARYINPPDSRYFVLGFRLCLAEEVHER